MSPHRPDSGRLFVDLAASKKPYSSPSSGDPDGHRGRSKHRSLARGEMVAAAVNTGGSKESSTFRGRPRRRSTSPSPSPTPLGLTPNRNVSPGSRLNANASSASSKSPSRKHLLRIAVLERRRRSQSPSRSRSPTRHERNVRRRRQRTRSRSRSHVDESPQRVKDHEADLRHEVLLRQTTKSPTKEG